MKKLFLFLFLNLFFVFSVNTFAANNFDRELSYNPIKNEISIKIFHNTLFNSTSNYKIIGKLNNFNTTFKQSVTNKKYLLITFDKGTKNSNNTVSVTINDAKGKALKTFSDTIFINNFNVNSAYHFFNPVYDEEKKVLSFNTFVNKKLISASTLKVDLNEKTSKLSFVSQNNIKNSSNFAIQTYALPVSSGNINLSVHYLNSNSKKVVIKNFVANISSEKEFPDVASNFWAYGTINWAKNFSYVSGRENNKFFPYESITRAEAVTILARLMNLDKPSSEIKSNLKDIANHWAEDNIKQLNNLKIVSGYSDSTFKPNNLITRAEAASIISNYLLYNNFPYSYKEGSNTFSDVKKSDWFVRPVESLNNMKIVSGYSDKTFKPSNAITRAEFISIVRNFNSDIYSAAFKK